LSEKYKGCGYILSTFDREMSSLLIYLLSL